MEPRFFGSIPCGTPIVAHISEKVYIKVSEKGRDNVLCLNDNQFRTLTTFSRVYPYPDADLLELLEKYDENITRVDTGESGLLQLQGP
ncbi:hypothetical protein [Vibrio phage vB_VpaP_SJSY21]|nr:hypothetical protein [Vibrio phage vB_VpaP_SJSY21]